MRKMGFFALQIARTYTCDANGNVICYDGWSDIESLCSIPICHFRNNTSGLNMTCDHGTCTAPNDCACEIGWEGARCETCLPLPGCLHGYCKDKAFECICYDYDKWTGEHCDKRNTLF